MADNLELYNLINLNGALRESFIRNGLTEGDLRYIKDIVNTRISMFSYDGLPEPLTPQILETALMFMNNLCFYHSTSLGGWILCRYIFGGDFDLYWKPTHVNLLTISGYPVAYEVPYSDIILVRDNEMDIIPFLPICEYIKKIKHIEDCMDKVLDICSLPLAIVGNKKQANALKVVASKLGHKNPFIIGDDTILDQVKAFDISVPISPTEIYDLKKKYLNECMSSLGIYSVDEKRERIVTQELVNQNDYTDFIYTGALNERTRFINELNSRAGLNIKIIESYEINRQDEIEEKSEQAKAVLLAQGEAIKKLDPNAEFGQSNPVKIKGGAN